MSDRARRALDRAGLTLPSELSLYDRQPVPRPLGIRMIGAEGGGPQRLDVPILSSGFRKAPLLE